jgi:hypothetical protein
MDAACALILEYVDSVIFEPLSETDIIVKSMPGKADGIRLCEMAFQMNFHQAPVYMCPACKAEIEKTGKGDAVCGHLTFTKPIK